MPIKNPKGLLTQAVKFPEAIEAMLPEGVPKVSTMLRDTADQIPAVPDFPMEVPDLPAPPEFPAFPTPPGGGENAGLRRYVPGAVTEVRTVPVPAPARPRPMARILGEEILS
ncbi:hypothetical protein ES707_03434 [subsurface metagenome]